MSEQDPFAEFQSLEKESNKATFQDRARHASEVFAACADGREIQYRYPMGWSETNLEILNREFRLYEWWRWRVKPGSEASLKPRKAWTCLNWTTHNEVEATTWKLNGQKVTEWQEVIK